MAKINCLEDRKVVLKPIIKAGGMNPAGHDGHFMYTGTEIHFSLPVDLKKGRLATILTREEQEFFENELGENLSIHAKEDNYWKSFKIKIRKDDKLMEHGYELDLSDPIDNLRWRVLRAHPIVSPTWAERNLKGEYRFALADMDELTENTARVADKKKEAYMFLGKIEGSTKKMADFLRVYGNKPAPTATADWLKGEIFKLIDNPITLDDMLNIVNDEDYELKLFIEDAVDAGAILKKTGKYFLVGGDPINKADSSLKGTIEVLKDYKRDADDIYLRIQSQIKNSKK